MRYVTHLMYQRQHTIVITEILLVTPNHFSYFQICRSSYKCYTSVAIKGVTVDAHNDYL